MAKWKSAVITDLGKELMAKVLSGSEIEFTKIKTSDHKYSKDVDLSKVITIPSIKQEESIDNIELINKNTVSIYSNFNNKDLTDGYEVRVVGLYAKDPESGSEILYSLTTTDRPDYLPSFNGVTLSSIDYKFVTAVGNAENVILDITDGGTVTQQQFQELKEEVEKVESELDNKVEMVNNVGGKKITLYGNFIDTYFESGETVTDGIDRLTKDIGNLSDLETNDKKNLVTAINEVNAKGTRSSTIVIATDGSSETSKKGADIIIENSNSDDAGAIITKAIESLKDTGGEIKLMEGDYILKSGIKIEVDNITLAGVGKATKIVEGYFSSGSQGSLIRIGRTGSSSGIPYTSNVTIKDLDITWRLGSDTYVGIDLRRATNANITNVDIYNITAHGIQILNDSTADIFNVNSHNNGRHGFHITENTSVNITNSSCYDNQSNGISLSKNSSVNMTSVKCYDNQSHGISVSDNSAANISNAVCTNNKLAGIYVSGSGNLKAVNCTISINDTNGIDIQATDNYSIIFIKDCYFQKNNECGVLTATKSQNVTISNCTFEQNSEDNNRYLNKAQINVGGTKVSTSDQASNILVNGCKIIDSTGKTRGMAIFGSNHAIINNQYVGLFYEKIYDDSTGSFFGNNINMPKI